MNVLTAKEENMNENVNVMNENMNAMNQNAMKDVIAKGLRAFFFWYFRLICIPIIKPKIVLAGKYSLKQK